MILRGILERSLGGTICIRGFANINDVAKISKPNRNYQREIDKEHKKEIKKYIEKREYLFFPEVILSYTLNANNDNGTIDFGKTDFLNTSSSKGKNIKFSTSKKEYAGEDSRVKDKVVTVSIDIADSFINENKLFKRIDGNHRLTAIEDIKNYQSDLNIPFCIILLQDDIKDIKFESIVFHNINTKGKHLTSEENLKAIFSNFNNAELKDNFSWAYPKAKTLVTQLDFEYLDSIKNSFVQTGNQNLHERTVIIELIEFLKEHKLIKANISGRELKTHLTKVNSIYNENQALKASNNSDLLIAFIYYSFKGEGDSNLHAFKNWVLKNKTYELRVVDKESIVAIFDKILESKIRIFMAMKYYDNSTVDNYNRIMKEAVDEIIIKNNHLIIEPYSIMREPGASLDIVDNLLNNIVNCEIFVVDISENNANVFYEYGYAKSLNKPIIVIKKKNDKSTVPFDIEHELRAEFNGDNELKDLLIVKLKQTLLQLGYSVNN